MARTKRQNRRLGIKTRRIRYSSRNNRKIRSQRKIKEIVQIKEL